MTMPAGAYMRASDAFSWYMERDPALRSTVVAVMWLDRAPDWDVLAARVDRISRLVPSLRQCVVESLFRLTAPRWTYDPHFDLNWHLRRVAAPTPRKREAVLQLARRSAMGAFDRDRPLWELTLVEGIRGGKAALILKIHHSLSDGVGGMQMLTLLCDLQRESPDLGEMPPPPPGETLDLRAMVAGTVAPWPGAAPAWPAAGRNRCSRHWWATCAIPSARSEAPPRWPAPSTGRPLRSSIPGRHSCGSGR